MESIQSVLQYNIAVCKTVRGQLDQASTLLKKVWQGQGPNCRVPAHIIMLVLYIELQLELKYINLLNLRGLTRKCWELSGLSIECRDIVLYGLGQAGKQKLADRG
ncbi:uncharacterized protein LOC112905384 isoform X1 [Agrilus planipennis]|uniref:Uncharacterized protein LOC112905384 isoform X1 n=1 Tax=Agrilus planipennis TaxID=224129 RepID=A0A7F5RBX8_AGRPL|nr:uncharacterized protein LOC112905384 isoform X1 [Agrilus planipennis]